MQKGQFARRWNGMMSVLSLAALYLLVGWIFTFLLDCLMVRVDPQIEFDWKEKTACTSFWQVFVCFTLVAFVQGIVGN